jgi:hypothetical protein
MIGVSLGSGSALAHSAAWGVRVSVPRGNSVMDGSGRAWPSRAWRTSCGWPEPCRGCCISPLPDGEQHVLFVSGDDAAAKAGLRSVLEADNFAAIDLGDPATGSRLQQAGGPLGGLDLRLSAAG